MSDCSSDIRLKTNITPYTYGLDKILQLKPVNFNWNEIGKNLSYEGNEMVMGFIAQDIEKIIPEWVSTNPEGYKAVANGDLKYILLNAVQELNDKYIKIQENIESRNKERDVEISELKIENDQLKRLLCLDHKEAEVCQ